MYTGHHQKIDELKMPKTKQINELRIASFKRKLAGKIEKGSLDLFKQIVQELKTESDLDALDIAAAAASMFQGEQPLLLPEIEISMKRKPETNRSETRSRKNKFVEEPYSDNEMVKYRVEVGHMHGVKAGNLLGAIANEAGLDGKYVGKISIRDEFSTVHLPFGMPADIFQELKKVRVSGHQLCISLDSNMVKPLPNGRKASHSRKRKKLSRLRQERVR